MRSHRRGHRPLLPAWLRSLDSQYSRERGRVRAPGNYSFSTAQSAIPRALESHFPRRRRERNHSARMGLRHKLRRLRSAKLKPRRATARIVGRGRALWELPPMSTFRIGAGRTGAFPIAAAAASFLLHRRRDARRACPQGCLPAADAAMRGGRPRGEQQKRHQQPGEPAIHEMGLGSIISRCSFEATLGSTLRHPSRAMRTQSPSTTSVSIERSCSHSLA